MGKHNGIMSFLRSKFFILILSVLLTACFHDGPTIHTDNDTSNDSDGNTTKNKGLPTITVTSSSHPDLIVGENQNSIVFTATLSEPVNEDIELSYQATAISGISNSATRQDDFLLYSQGRNASSDTVIIPADSTQVNFTVNINNDLVDESDELFAVNIGLFTPADTSPGAEVITEQLIVTIADDDPLPVIILSSEHGTVITVKESVGVIPLQLKMPVSLSASNVEIPVEFTAPPDIPAATAGEDFIDPGSIIFPGVTTESKDFSTFNFELLIRDDAVKEDNETFYFSLKNPLHNLATLSEGTPAITVIIEDDDANGGINDTQVITCADDKLFSTTCGNPDYPSQDGEINTEYNTRWLDSNGDETTNNFDAVCVKDVNTGLIWEIKSSDNTSYRYKNWVFTWYNNLSNTNGGYDGITGGSNDCDSTIGDCSTKTYVAELNSNVLCGNTNWRLPRVHELVSIMNFESFPDPDFPVMVDRGLYPNTMSGYYWTANPVADFSLQAWAVYFGKTPTLQPDSEFVIPYDKVKSIYIRGVANSN